MITQRDQENCNSIVNGFIDDTIVNKSIWRIDNFTTEYSVGQKNEGAKNISNEHLYSASAIEIDEKRPELKDLPSHLEYAYLHTNESFPVIILSKLSKKEKRLFLQFPIAPEDQEKTTFTCPYGTFSYRRMLFGLCNAPATFQRCMTGIFHDMVEDFIEVFMDDFSVFGNSFNTCLTNLDKVLARCEETNLGLNWEKCHFMDAKPRLIRWVMLLQGFNIEIKDKKGAENLAANHLYRLENPHLDMLTEREITDEFPDEHLMMLQTKWYTDLSTILSGRLSRQNGHSKKERGDTIVLLLQQERSMSLDFIDLVFLKDAKEYVMKCDACQRSGNISSRSKMPQNNIKVEAQALPTNDARVVVKFLRELFARFGVPKSLISDRGTYFCNSQLEKALEKYGVTHRLSTVYHP
ncbi:reverse transcriptase domain-containing protein [Tanacetum coccineum]